MSTDNRNQIKFNNGIYKAIAKSIPSPRARSTNHLSSEYVSAVLRGKVTRDNATTREIFRKAKEIQSVLNS